MGARYKTGKWHNIGAVAVGDHNVAKLEVADLFDTRTGDVYERGARRVVVSKWARDLTGMRTRTFRGETAWNSADVYARDLELAARREA